VIAINFWHDSLISETADRAPRQTQYQWLGPLHIGIDLEQNIHLYTSHTPSPSPENFKRSKVQNLAWIFFTVAFKALHLSAFAAKKQRIDI